MINEREIRERLNGFLAHRESVNDFADWLAKEFSSVRYNEDAIFDIGASIQNLLEVYFEGVIDERLLRKELRNFVSNSNEIQERAIQFAFDDRDVPPPREPLIQPSANSPVQFRAVSFALL